MMPTYEEFMASLQEMRRHTLEELGKSTAAGDRREARTWEKMLRQIEGMILKKGGTLDQSEATQP